MSNRANRASDYLMYRNAKHLLNKYTDVLTPTEMEVFRTGFRRCLCDHQWLEIMETLKEFGARVDREQSLRLNLLAAEINKYFAKICQKYLRRYIITL